MTLAARTIPLCKNSVLTNIDAVAMEMKNGKNFKFLFKLFQTSRNKFKKNNCVNRSKNSRAIVNSIETRNETLFRLGDICGR